MSFNFSFTAQDKEDAAAKLAEAVDTTAGNCPDNVASAIESVVNSLPDLEDSTISVSAYGHIHDSANGRGTSNISITISNAFAAKPVDPSAEINEVVPSAEGEVDLAKLSADDGEDNSEQ